MSGAIAAEAKPIISDCNVLLIGSTGMGKSTFGNYLNGMDRKPVFPMAKDNRPTTQAVNLFETKATAQIKSKSTNFKLTIIDTPGLNESAAQDFDHMTKLVQALQKIEHIHACVLVVKFNAKIDAQYKATMQYYCKLLPDLFEKNVIIVMTDFATDERSVRIRERQGIDVEQMKINTCTELQKCAGSLLIYQPILLLVDCLPYGEEEKKYSEATRNEFFEYVFEKEPTTLTDFKVAKLVDIKNDDAQKIQLLEGEINGYKERLEEAEVESEEVFEEVKARENENTKAQNVVENLKDMIKEKDKDTEVTATSWSIDQPRKFRSTEYSFHIESPYEKTRVHKWTNCTFKEYKETDNGAIGIVEPKFMRRCRATVEVFTEKRMKYEKEIKELKEKLQEAKVESDRMKKVCTSLQEKHEKHKEQIVLFQRYIDERRDHIRKYSSEFLTLEEAQERLKNI